MAPISSTGMKNVLRLTRSGDVSDATRLIQQLLSARQQPEQFTTPTEVRSAQRVVDIKPLVLARSPEKEQPATKAQAARGKSTRHTYSFAGRTLIYDLYVPAGATVKLPLLVMLHGCTQSAQDFALGTGMNDVAEELGFAVAYPEQPAGANPQRCWNWFRPGDQGRDGGEPALLAGLTQEIMATKLIDPSRVYIAGLSAGGAAAANMAAAYPDIYAAVGIHSGLACGSARDVPSAFAAMKGSTTVRPVGDLTFVPTITFHGGRDQTVNPLKASQIHNRFAGHARIVGARDVQDRGITASGRRYIKDAQIDTSGVSLSESWTIPDAGHAWMGGSSAGSYTDPGGPDASRAFAQFFLQHRLNDD